MKAQILKIAGVKSEKEFYKKYPSEEAFMKQHSKAFKKAQMGTVISGGDKTSNPKMLNLKTFYDQSDMDVTGMNDEMRQKQLAAQAAQTPAAAPAAGGGGGGIGGMIGSLSGILGGGEGGAGGGEGGAGGMESIMGMLGGARYGADIPRAQQGGSWQGSMFNQPSIPQQGYTPGTISLNDDQVQNEGGQYDGYAFQGGPNTGGKQAPSGMEGVMSGIAKYAVPAGKLYEGYQALRGERRARKAAEQQEAVSDITLKASQTRPEEIKRKYVRPEDIQNTGEEFFPIYGVGTNPLARNGIRLQDGGGIGGNPTEIQNTYGNGNSIYDDLGYEPLTDPNQVKSFYHGGRLHRMQDGGAAAAGGGTPWGAISGVATGIGQEAMGGQNAGGQIGSTIGSTVGMLGGPIGSAIGGFVGGIAGNALDTNAKTMKKAQAATQRNITKMGLNSGFQSIQGQNQSYMENGGDINNYEDGGYMNPEYNPQVITMFGDHNSQDFADYAHKNQYRAGGHLKSYTPPSERAMEIYEDGGDVKSYGLGGELETHWGGGFENLSYNPHLPGTGITGIFRGKSHEERSPNGETGIGVTYGGNPVEVERGEPMVELEEGGVVDPETGEVQKSGVVFGNLKIPNQYLDLLGDKSAKGKKFKNYVADLSKLEEKQNKLIEKSTSELDGFTPITSFDKLKLTALQANIEGANMKLKDIADKKINAAALQNAINDTAEEHGLVADDLARGKVKIDKKDMETREARWGDSIAKKAKDGVTTTKETTIVPKKEREAYITKGFKPDPKNPNRLVRKKEAVTTTTPETTKIIPGVKGTGASATTGQARPGGKAEEPWRRKMIAELNRGVTYEELAKKGHGTLSGLKKMFPNEYRPLTGTADVPERIERIPGTSVTTPGLSEEVTVDNGDEGGGEKPRFPWEMIGNQLLNYIRPSDQEALDNAQLYPEMYALSSNQLEPVPAQGYQPDLGVPYDISFQDQLNANQADYRAAQRTMGYNPAAQANLNAQKYQANQGILGNQFRANQEMKDKVYGENRNILNQAKLTNLGIYDTQYQRQAQALSNTKATTQAALNSIADKYAKSKLENRTLGVYENMYNYRFGKSGRAQNWNGIQFFDTSVGGAKSRQDQAIPPGYKVTGYDAKGKPKLEAIAEEDVKMDLEALNAAGKTPGIGDNRKNGRPIKKNYKNSSVVRAYKNL
jgi:hypothetical protein